MITGIDPIGALAGGLIVSCQARGDHPLSPPWVIARLAACAAMGGAVGLRIEHPDDVHAVKSTVDLPVIGLTKVAAGDRNLITPSWQLAADLAAAGADIIAFEATDRGEVPPEKMVARIHEELNRPVMADVATLTQGRAAWAAGADLVSSTLSGYTADSPQQSGPDLALVEELAAEGVRVVAEGRLSTSDDVRGAFAAGAYAAVVGTAITDPVWITAQLVQVSPVRRGGPVQ